MKIEIATSENFSSLIETGYAVVDFMGDHCSVCRILEPHYQAAAGDYPMIRFLQCNADHEPEIAKKLEIKGLPTVVFFRDGHEVLRKPGMRNRKEIDAFLTKLLYE